MKRFQVTQEEAESLCRKVPEFRRIVSQTELPSFERCEDLFVALVQSIVFQQLAIKAAEAIFARVENLLGAITAENLLAAPEDALRSCGLSARKTAYLRGIAEARQSGSIDFAALAEKSDAEVTSQLVQLKGVGVWTAEMLLIFSLGRPDVLSFNDLGIRRGIMMLEGLDGLTPDDFDRFRRRCSPHGTAASLYLWRIKDGGLDRTSASA